MEKTIEQMKKDFVLRERTQDIALETSYCRHCGFNSYENIGRHDCAKCGHQKAS